MLTQMFEMYRALKLLHSRYLKNVRSTPIQKPLLTWNLKNNKREKKLASRRKVKTSERVSYFTFVTISSLELFCGTCSIECTLRGRCSKMTENTTI